MRAPLLAQQDLADELVEHLVGDVEVRPDDHAGDDHDDRSLHDLVLAGPLDLPELPDRLADELDAPSSALTRRPNRACRRLRRAPIATDASDGELAAATAAAGAGHGALARLAPRAALRSRLTGHQRVSLWAVCRPHQRQYFLS